MSKKIPYKAGQASTADGVVIVHFNEGRDELLSGDSVIVHVGHCDRTASSWAHATAKAVAYRQAIEIANAIKADPKVVPPEQRHVKPILSPEPESLRRRKAALALKLKSKKRRLGS